MTRHILPAEPDVTLHTSNDRILDALRAPARNAPESGIVEVVNVARELPDVIPLWVGEGDLPTPAFICEAADAAMKAGETFYTYQRGLPELRKALADYHGRVFGRPFDPERFFVTGSGMQAIQIAVQMIAGQGDEVLVPVPAWPNIAASVGLMGGVPVSVPLDFTQGGWSLDVARLEAAITPRTRAIFINTPANPTGWVASREDLKQILDISRRRGIWIIADEVYGRFYYGAGNHAPSFHEIAEEDDRVIQVNTFSKNWAMTGWRIGWMSAPKALGQVIENMVQYSTSGVAAFMQRGAIAALSPQGDAFLEEQKARALAGRKIVCDALAAMDGVRFTVPDGSFYMFFGIEGHTDARQLAMDLALQARVGLAPASAFGVTGQGFLRLCFARRADHVEEGMRRLAAWLKR